MYLTAQQVWGGGCVMSKTLFKRLELVTFTAMISIKLMFRSLITDIQKGITDPVQCRLQFGIM